MKVLNDYRFSRKLISWIFFGTLFVFLAACQTLSTTTIIKVAPPKTLMPDPNDLVLITPSCLNLTESRFTQLLQKDPDLRPLKTIYNNQEDLRKLHILIQTVLKEQKVTCTRSAEEEWKELRGQLIKDNEGLFDDKISEQYQLRSAFDKQDQISISNLAPMSLSLSSRPLPAEQESGGFFAGLKERAQAAIIDYAQAFKPDDKEIAKQKVTPEKAAGSLLEALNPPRESRVAGTQRVELTISSAVNSASVEDRFDYISAYLKLPALPGRLNGRVSVERQFLAGFQGLVIARPEFERVPSQLVSVKKWEEFVKADLRRALDNIRVRIEIIDPLQTEAEKIALGKLTSQAGLGVAATQTAQTSFQVTSITPSISAAREDTLQKQLDRRSAWVNSDRSLLRITQRGMRETTISGSISSALTLRIPKTSLYVLDVVVRERPKEEAEPATNKSIKAQKKTKLVDKKNVNQGGDKITEVKLVNIEQPLYGTVDAVGIALGTVRVAKPSTYPFKKELDGVAYTHVERPVSLRLWKSDRELQILILEELNPKVQGKKEGLRALGIYSTVPPARQIALFKKTEDWGKFIKELKDGKLRLIEHEKKVGWYIIGSKLPSESDCEFEDEPTPGQVWLGIEDKEGFVVAFDKEQSELLKALTIEKLLIEECKRKKTTRIKK